MAAHQRWYWEWLITIKGESMLKRNRGEERHLSYGPAPAEVYISSTVWTLIVLVRESRTIFRLAGIFMPAVQTGGDTLRRVTQITHLRNVATQAPWRSEERTLVCRPAGRSSFTILPRPNALSLSRRLKRVWAKSIWNGDTHVADSREERLVLYWLSYTTMFTEMLMKRDWTALFIQMPAHVRVYFQRNGNVLFSKYPISMWSSCPCHRSIISGPFFTCKTPLQRRWFTPPINYNMEYGQRLLLRLAMMLAHGRL